MKKPIFLCVFMFTVPLFMWAQGFYFDAGLNLGGSGSNYVYDHIYDEGELPFEEGKINFVKNNLQLKAGYGPFGNIPAYVVAYGEIGIAWNPFTWGGGITGGIGTGVLFYPWRLLQLGASIGVNWMENSLPIDSWRGFLNFSGDRIDEDYEVDSSPGFAWSISAGFDFGKKNHGFLLGINYFGSINKFSYSYSVTESHSSGAIVDEPYTGKGNGTVLRTEFTLFVKYAYRKKPF
jgi:hypothetical protein